VAASRAGGEVDDHDIPLRRFQNLTFQNGRPRPESSRSPSEETNPTEEEILAFYRSGLGYGEAPDAAVPAFVPLSRGLVRVLDSADRHLVAHGRPWHVIKANGGLHAARSMTIARGKRKAILLHTPGKRRAMRQSACPSRSNMDVLRTPGQTAAL
jgi:hypothetical protein